MELRLLEGRCGEGYTTFGSVWAKGEAQADSFSLKQENGTAIPVQSRVTARWPDGSVKWAAHTADATQMGNHIWLEQGCGEQPVAGIELQEKGGQYHINTGRLSMVVPSKGSGSLAHSIHLDGRCLASRIYPVFQLERRQPADMSIKTESCFYEGRVDEVQVEESGPLQCVLRFTGVHVTGKNAGCTMPFVVRIYLHTGSAELRFTHTFFYDGDAQRDFVKGIGLRFDVPLAGAPYARHVKYGTDTSLCFHEAAVLLNSNGPKLPPERLQAQMAGSVEEYPAASPEVQATQNLPVWNRYTLCQHSAFHYAIRKQTGPECCLLDCKQGNRAPGSMAVCSASGGVSLAMKDFWQKHPAGLEVDGLGEDVGQCTAWFYSPEAEAYDFRHYDTRSYPATSYEGFDYVGADAKGIAVTSECTAAFAAALPTDEAMNAFARKVQKPPLYVASPEYYHAKRAFGYWSLPQSGTEAEAYIEKQLDAIVEFYLQEVDARSWYGLYDYGDVMHTYDPVRHTWRYDMGGFAWQNTELVPTYWLWYTFLRTGREDVFTLAEAMARHCSEVDMYHFGPLKGLGSRHNVRHWGCACKEPRVSMAGHHRFYYYLTGDYRMGDVLNDVADADSVMQNNRENLREKNDGSGEKAVYVRSGPDWSSFVSNWMTRYERTLDEAYRHKIEQGICDLAGTPLGLSSGPEFWYEHETGHLIYIGEDDKNFNTHLQICMGGPEIWFETADMLDNEILKELLVRQGRFYFLPKAQKTKESGGLIVNRPYSHPFFAADIAAYSAKMNQDASLAKNAWQHLLYALVSPSQPEGFAPQVYATTESGKQLLEIPWLKTNFSAQWCMNTIVALEFIREYLPENLEEIFEMVESLPEGNFHSA